MHDGKADNHTSNSFLDINSLEVPNQKGFQSHRHPASAGLWYLVDGVGKERLVHQCCSRKPEFRTLRKVDQKGLSIKEGPALHMPRTLI